MIQGADSYNDLNKELLAVKTIDLQVRYAYTRSTTNMERENMSPKLSLKATPKSTEKKAKKVEVIYDV